MHTISNTEFDLVWVGEQCWLLTPTDKNLIPIYAQSLRLSAAPYLENVTSCFTHILLEFSLDYCPLDVPDYCHQLLSQLEKTSKNQQSCTTHTLPIDFSAGLDLEELAATCGLSIGQLQKDILNLELVVMVNGFAPGFSYCGELPKALQVPRRATPRVHIPAGSVAIADKYLAVYPQISPGGWHIIGHCSQRLFDVTAKQPNRLNLGDKLSFYEAEDS